MPAATTHGKSIRYRVSYPFKIRPRFRAACTNALRTGRLGSHCYRPCYVVLCRVAGPRLDVRSSWTSRPLQGATIKGKPFCLKSRVTIRAHNKLPVCRLLGTPRRREMIRTLRLSSVFNVSVRRKSNVGAAVVSTLSSTSLHVVDQRRTTYELRLVRCACSI